MKPYSDGEAESVVLLLEAVSQTPIMQSQMRRRQSKACDINKDFGSHTREVRHFQAFNSEMSIGPILFPR